MINQSLFLSNDKTIGYIKNIVLSNKLSHSYIIAGEEGIGKSEYAYYFAKLLHCKTKDINCNECMPCKQLSRNNNPDVIWIRSSNKSIPVDDIREKINSDVLIKPYSHEMKVYIIEDGDKMLEGAQNALLKTIEEPPVYALIIILVEDINKILNTIISRCNIIDVKPIDKKVIEEYLIKEYRIPDYLANMASVYSGGNLVKAIKFVKDENFNDIKEQTILFLKKINKQAIKYLTEFVKKIAGKKEDINDYFDIMVIWYRDLLVYKTTKDKELLILKDEASYMEENADNISYKAINIIINAIEKAKERIKYNVNFEYNIEVMLLILKENYDG